MSTSTPIAPVKPRIDFDQSVDNALDSMDFDGVGDGWACVRTDDFPCPASGCTFIARFMTAAHRVVVWPSTDDPRLLRHAHEAKAAGRNPRVTEYQREFGPCIPYDLYVQLGRPVHGVRERPSGYPPTFR